MASLTGVTISSAYKSLLKVNDETNGVDDTLEVIEDGEGTDSCLYLSTKQLKIKSATDIDATFDVQNSSSHQLLTIDTNSSPEEVIINEGGLGTIDFRVESANNSHALFVDSSADLLRVDGATLFTRQSVTNLAADGSIPITGTCANIDGNGSVRAGIRFAGAGTAGQILLVNNTGGEALTFHNTEGTALLRGVHPDHDTMEANFMGMFVSDGTYWNLIAGGVDSQPDVGLTAS